MARNKFFTDVDLTGNQLKNSKPQYVTGTPPVDDQSPWTNITGQGLSANPADGQLAYETISKTLLVYKTPNSTIQEAGWYTASSQGGSPSPTQSNFFNFDLEIAEDSLVSDNTFVIDVSGIDKQRIWDAIEDEKVIRISIFPEQNADLSRLPIDFPELGNGYENLIATVYDYGVKDFGDDYFMKFIMLSIDCDWSGVDIDEDPENITIDMPPKIVIIFSGDVHDDEVEWSDTAYAIKMNNNGSVSPSGDGYPQTIDGRTQYRTLLKSEWDYILNTRAGGTVGSTTNARYVKARIGEKNGLILFPDGIDLPEMELININTPTGGFDDNDPISPEDWDDLEKLGVVFLPCTGRMSRDEYNSDNTVGYYRTASIIGSNNSSGWVLVFSTSSLSIVGTPGTSVPAYASVRLVTDTQNSYGTFAVNSNGDNVLFTRGNLQENDAMGMWRFADQPWKICGMNNELSQHYSGLSPLWHDLFYKHNYQYEDVDPYEDLVGSNAPADWGVWISKKYIPVDELQNNIEELQRGEYPPIWRTPTKNEWEYLLSTRNSSTVSGTINARFAKAQVNNINGLILLPDVFTLPVGITMTNINVGNVTASDNTYTISQWETLENAGCIFLPCGGVRPGQFTNYINNHGYYSSVNLSYSGEAYCLLIRDTSGWNSVYVDISNKHNGISVRFFQDEPNGQFSISNTGKVNIAKSNLQFHCLNKEWRFAPNAWDIIGLDNENIAENYDGWIDLFGYGTSGWDSGAVCYQPWSISLYDSDYLNHNLKGDYKNADWGVYNFSKQLQPVAFSGDYNDLENKPVIPAAQVQADWNQTDNTQPDYIKNKPDVDSLEDNVDDLNNGTFPGGWRTPTANEWTYIIDTRSASTVSSTANARYVKAQVNSINGLILLPDVFTLPSGIIMNNINDSTAAFSGNTYTISQWETLENSGCVFLPAAGNRNGINTYDVGSVGYYWTSLKNSDIYAWFFTFRATFVNLGQCMYNGGCSVRLIQDDNTNGLFSISNNTKCNIAKSNLQFHCLNKEWRFAPNSYDVIGNGNRNVAENYNGYIDLFGFGTSGWNSGAVCYQPWNNSTNNADYINHDLTGDYKNADWGVYNMKKQLHPVAFTGDYNDLENKPELPNDLLIFYDGTQFVCNMTAQEVAENMFKCLKQRTSCFVNHWYYVDNERNVKGGYLTFNGLGNLNDTNIYRFNFVEMENSGDTVEMEYDLSNNTLLLSVNLSGGDDPYLYYNVPITITDEIQEVIDFWTASTI